MGENQVVADQIGEVRVWAMIEMPDGQIESGTSGGHVVDQEGRLIGIVSTSGGGTGSVPRPSKTLPVWVWDRIRKAQDATG